MSTLKIKEHFGHEERHKDTTTVFGFFVYLMTDLVLFASLFAVYAVLYQNTAGGPKGSDIFVLPFVLTQTLILLASSLTCGLALLCAKKGSIRGVVSLLSITLVLGGAFLFMELYEFGKFIQEGYGPHVSGFLSAYFTLVGTHGVHIFAGLLFGTILIVSLVHSGFTRGNLRKLALFTLFWHFLDLVWIFIFSFVYLGAFI